MNETRKQIIELIGDYMDKTFKFGCYYIPQIGRKYGKDIGGVAKQYNPKKGEEPVVLKILGHYDITAVLKYIENQAIISNFYIGAITLTMNLWEKMSPGDLLFGNKVIPNKPVHLYTEQEEKDLLELLLKLK